MTAFVHSKHSGKRALLRPLFKVARTSVIVLLACLTAFGLVMSLNGCASNSATEEVQSAEEGKPAPDFEFEVLYATGDEAPATGTTLRLSDLKGQIVVLDFWATWCGYCAQDMPTWDKLAQEHPNDLVVIAINRGDDEEAATQYAKQHGYNFLWSIDTNRTQECYASSGIPYDVVIDKNGVVKRIILGSLGDKQYSTMENLIQELNAAS